LVVAVGASETFAPEACPRGTAAAGPTLAAESAADLQHTIFAPASPKVLSILAGALLIVPFGLSTLGLSCRDRAVRRLDAPHCGVPILEPFIKTLNLKKQGHVRSDSEATHPVCHSMDYGPEAVVEEELNWLKDHASNTGSSKLVPRPKAVFAPRVLGDVLEVAEVGAPPST
jgi:hypothetical protein